MNDPKVEKQPPVPPFVQFCCAAIPQVFDDSLSYYEALCAMWKYLDNTVKVINNNAMITEDFIAKVNELHDYVENYFANLDVQEEINNKLDQMAEDGTLQEIITTYIQSNVAWTFDTVADMKLAENLIAGSYAQTLGFHTLNDGGGAIYKISDSGTANEMDVIAVGTLYANLVLPTVLAPEQVGCYGDGTSNDTTAFARACELSKFVQGKGNYLVNTISLSDVDIKANIYAREITGVTFTDNVTFEGTFDHTVGGTVDDGAVGIYVTGNNNVIKNSIFKAELYTGIAISLTNDSKDIKILNCRFKPDYKIDIWCGGGNVFIDKCTFDEHTANTLATLSVYGNGIKVSKYLGVGDANNNNIKITNNELYDHGDNPIDCYTGATNVLIDGNYINSPTHTNIEIKADGENTGEYNHEYVITNNIMYGARNIRILNNNDSTINNFTIGNNIFHTTAGSCLILEENFDYNITNCIFNGANQTNIYAISPTNTTGTLVHLTVSDCTFDNFLAVIGEGTGLANIEVTFNNIVAKNIAKFIRVRSTSKFKVNNSYISCSGTCFGNVEGDVYVVNSTIACTTGFAVASSDAKISLINCILNASGNVFSRGSSSVLFKYALVACDYSGSGSIGSGSMSITDSVGFSTVS